MQWAFLVLAVVAGVLNTVQAGANTALKKAMGAPAWAALIVLTVAWLAALAAALLSNQRFPGLQAASSAPWWAYIGGVCGVTYVFSMLTVADKLGAAVFMALTVTMAVITSLILDHWGLLGFEVHRAGWLRIAGGVMMVGGLALIARG